MKNSGGAVRGLVSVEIPCSICTHEKLDVVKGWKKNASSSVIFNAILYDFLLSSDHARWFVLSSLLLLL